jgi:hypothetical protein
MALVEDFLGLVPISIFLCTLQVCTVVTVEVLEDSVLVLQSTIVSDGSILDRSKSSGLLLGG